MSVLDLILWAPIVAQFAPLLAKVLIIWFAVSIVVVVLLPLIGLLISELRDIGREYDE